MGKIPSKSEKRVMKDTLRLTGKMHDYIEGHNMIESDEIGLTMFGTLDYKEIIVPVVGEETKPGNIGGVLFKVEGLTNIIDEEYIANISEYNSIDFQAGVYNERNNEAGVEKC